MPIGDEDRRKKSTQHREAAFRRWENTPQRYARKGREQVEDTAETVRQEFSGRSVRETLSPRRFSSLAGWIGYVVLLLFALPALFIRQLAAFVREVGRFIRWAKVDYFLPPSVVGFIQWLIETLPRAIGLRPDPNDSNDHYWQVASATVLLVFAIFFSTISGGLLAALVAVALVWMLLGVLRFFPAFDRRYTQAVGSLPVEDDYDIPGWSRD